MPGASDAAIVMFGDGRDWHGRSLSRAFKRRGITPLLAPLNSCGFSTETATGLDIPGLGDRLPEGAFVRFVPGGSFEEVTLYLGVLHGLRELGVTVWNDARAIERCVDKFYTSALLREAGLDTPETVVCERIDDAMAAVREMGDVIIKPLFGSMGHGMVRVSDPEVAVRVFRALELTRAVFYVQRVIDHAGCDVRAFVVGDRVVAAIERRSRDGGWRTNISLGGEARAIDPPDAWASLALTAARAVGADYAGVDLLPAPDGTVYVLEANAIPGWSGVQSVASVDIAGAIVDHLIAKVRP